ncbi:Mitochondrial outer membrane protein iml2 [Orbilia blumenaviensis]|uniref:Mitochondrial outer membrane protein iml2 n=1 Tax=Orbilia blumenaviensis TaxID=1796055 RepID=A0AAV9VGK1_9PEZI
MDEKQSPVGEQGPEDESFSKTRPKHSVTQTSSESGSKLRFTASMANRVGSLSSALFLGSSLFSIGCMGWFAFLWWGTSDNQLWRSIVLNDWAVRAISLPSSVFRIAITLQAGQCLSMLAALAIEKSVVPLPDLAAISMMRATPPGTTQTLLNFVYPLARAPGVRDLGALSIASLSALILLTSSILGFTSTILLSDVVIQPIPSENVETSIAIDYDWRGTSFNFIPTRQNTHWWSNSPVTLPSFAEYSEEAPVVPGLLDTGTTIRSFLPFKTPEERSSVRRYKGKSVVWDARVICQSPDISNFEVLRDPKTDIALAVTGNVRISIPSDKIQLPEPQTAEFYCGITEDTFYALNGIVICQLPNSDLGSLGRTNGTDIFPDLSYSGGLVSEFSMPGRKKRNGAAYLILNRTALAEEDKLDGSSAWGKVGYMKDPNEKEEDPTNPLLVVGSLCYTPLDAVVREVDIHRTQSVQEPDFAKFGRTTAKDSNSDNYTKLSYVFEDTLPLLLPGQSGKKPEARGLFNLERPPSGWAMDESYDYPVNSDGPWATDSYMTDPLALQFLVDALHLKYHKPYAKHFSDSDDIIPYDIYGNLSVVLDEEFAEAETGLGSSSWAIAGRDWQKYLFAGINNHRDGNIARALQGILTVVASNAYYSNLQTFSRNETVSLVTFRNVSSPGGPYGTRRGGEYALLQQGLFSTQVEGSFPVGYAIVAIVLGLQIIISAVILARFLRETNLTRIGDSWQALAQIAGEEFEGMEAILEVSRRIDADRAAVAKEMKNMGVDETRVGVELQDHSAHLIRRRRGVAPV